MSRRLVVAFLLLATMTPAIVTAQQRMKALIVDGQNNHADWPKTTFMMKKYLEDTGLFSVDIARTKYLWRSEKHLADYPLKQGSTTFETVKQARPDASFRPDFSRYDVVVSNYNGAPWPTDTQNALSEFVTGGGGLVIVHAANNAFGDWPEYNEMIGLGGWGGRNENSGPYVYLNDKGEVVRDKSKGRGGHHGPQHPFSIIVRDDSHPITKGMPREWQHTKDELYDLLRGPATNMRILATAYADPAKGGSGRHEPMMMTIEYGKGRVFHTPMGHADYSQECVGFILTLQRGTEWAATGKVTQEIPADFPTADSESSRAFGG